MIAFIHLFCLVFALNWVFLFFMLCNLCNSFSFYRNNEEEIEGKNVKSKEILAFGLIDKNKDESISKHEMSNMFQRMSKEQVKIYH